MRALTSIHWSGTIDAAHFIPGHPKCGRMHGHTYKIEVDIQTEVEEQHPRFILDYALIKDTVHQLDHKLLIPERHANFRIAPVDAAEVDPAKRMLHVQWPDGVVQLRPNAICLLPVDETSSEVMSQYLAQLFCEQLFAQYGKRSRVVVVVAETPSTTATSEFSNLPLQVVIPPRSES